MPEEKKTHKSRNRIERDKSKAITTPNALCHLNINAMLFSWIFVHLFGFRFDSKKYFQSINGVYVPGLTWWIFKVERDFMQMRSMELNFWIHLHLSKLHDFHLFESIAGLKFSKTCDKNIDESIWSISLTLYQPDGRRMNDAFKK